jgi:flagellar motor switch/type III secretory pathway protein FliN
MIFALRFANEPMTVGGRAVRATHFEPVSNVRVSMVIEMANNASDQLSRLFDTPVTVDVFEPVVVPTESQPALFGDAVVFRAHGRDCDVLVVYRDADARRILQFAFGERDETSATLSAIEEQVLERMAREIGMLCAPFCGEVYGFGRSFARMEQHTCATYFELRLGSPVDAVVGIGLSKDPTTEIEQRVDPMMLNEVKLDVRARIARLAVPARSLSAIAVGSVVTFETKLSDLAELRIGRSVIAQGECGVRDGNFAFAVVDHGLTGGRF